MTAGRRSPKLWLYDDPHGEPMKTLRTLITLNTSLLFLLGFGTVLFPQSFLAVYLRENQEIAILRFLGTGMGALAFVLMVASISPWGDWRRLAIWLSFADFLIGGAAFTLAIWGSPVGWFLVLVLFGLAVTLTWAGLHLKPAEIAAEVAGLQIPGEMREALLRQIGEAAAQEERNRLARDLHDSIKQQLFSINVGTATAQERWERDPEGARTALVDVRRSAREAMVEMQALLHQLRPQALGSTSGLVEALREQCEALGYRSGAQVTVELGPEIPDDRMQPGAQEALFRIAQDWSRP